MGRRDSQLVWDTEQLPLMYGEPITTYKVSEAAAGGTIVRVERRITLTSVQERTIIETPWNTLEHFDCFCCSCEGNEYTSSDPCCRNHGFDGRRPCDVHKTEGQEDEAGKMPASVQEARND